MLNISTLDYEQFSKPKQFGLIVAIFTFYLSGLFVLINRITILFFFIFALTTIFSSTVLVDSEITPISVAIIISSFFVYSILDVICYISSGIVDKENILQIRE